MYTRTVLYKYGIFESVTENSTSCLDIYIYPGREREREVKRRRESE